MLSLLNHDSGEPLRHVPLLLLGGDVELVGVDDVRVAVDNGEAAKVAYVIFLHSRFVVFNIVLFPVPQPDQFDLHGDGKRKRVQQTYDLRASHRTGSRICQRWRKEIEAR